MISRHQRSKSFPDKRTENGLDDSHGDSLRLKLDIGQFKSSVKNEQQSPKVETQTSLKQEILQLEKRLQDQFAERRALEKTLGSGSFSYERNEPASILKPATELIKEISVLELEVTHLEQYLLSLYRKAFDQQISLVPRSAKHQQIPSASITSKDPKISYSARIGKDWRVSSPPVTPRRLFVNEEDAVETATNIENPADRSAPKMFDNSNVNRCHSSLSYRAAATARPCPNSLSEALRICHSQPLSMTEYVASNVISLAEHLGTRISDHIPETPNVISEDMVKCIAAIFCKLGEPPSLNNALSSPNSSPSSISAFSPQRYHQCDVWSPGFGKYSSFDIHLDNPFNVEGLKEFNGPYSKMVEVQCICRESQKVEDVEYMLQHFRSLISQLQDVDLKKMKHEEKLAFWINVHNALLMHAYLAYGIPRNNIKRVFLLLKAAYNVGGHTISADTIQSYILGCRMSRPGQWLRMFVSPRTKFKAVDRRQTYAIGHPEPLLHFALCSGSHSDPALRVYTPKRVLQELEGAKDDYIQAAFGVGKAQKAMLPKLVESYAKELGLCSSGIMEMIQHCLPDSLRRTLKKCESSKSRKNIEWTPHNFSFRYLISKELLK